MRLAQLVAALEAVDPRTPVPIGFGHPHSYRGDYFEVAFCVVRDTTAGAMHAAAHSALGATYPGWKGGEYTMDSFTPCWLVPDVGETGELIGPVLLAYMLGRLEPGDLVP